MKHSGQSTYGILNVMMPSTFGQCGEGRLLFTFLTSLKRLYSRWTVVLMAMFRWPQKAGTAPRLLLFACISRC